MTAYELLDLKMALADRMLDIAKIWLTMSFAAFAGAQYISTLDNKYLLLAVTLLYLAGLVSLLGLAQFTKVQGDALEADALALQSELDTKLSMLDRKVVWMNPVTFYGQRALIILSFLGFLVYAGSIY